MHYFTSLYFAPLYLTCYTSLTFRLLYFAYLCFLSPVPSFTVYFSLFTFVFFLLYFYSSAITVISLHIQVLVLVPFARFLLHNYIHCSIVAFTWIFQYRCYCRRCCTFFGSISKLLKVLEFGTLGDLGLGQSKFHFFQNPT